MGLEPETSRSSARRANLCAIKSRYFFHKNRVHLVFELSFSFYRIYLVFELFCLSPKENYLISIWWHDFIWWRFRCTIVGWVGEEIFRPAEKWHLLNKKGEINPICSLIIPYIFRPRCPHLDDHTQTTLPRWPHPDAYTKMTSPIWPSLRWSDQDLLTQMYDLTQITSPRSSHQDDLIKMTSPLMIFLNQWMYSLR